MTLAYLGLGANLGPARETLVWAIEQLHAVPDSRVLRRSSFYLSEPLDATGPDFVNAVVELETSLCAPALLAAMQAIEEKGGRLRPYRNAPRTLDLDLLLFGQGRISSDELEVPHPRMHQRAFVLRPLAELDPGLASAEQIARISDQVIRRL